MADVIIVDTDLEFSKSIKLIIESYFDKHNIIKAHGEQPGVDLIYSKFQQCKDAILSKSISNKSTNIYFLEVDLNHEITGLELACAIRRVDAQSYIIFITSCVEVMNQVLQYNIKPLNFIVKSDPLLKQRVESVLDQIEYEKYLLSY